MTMVIDVGTNNVSNKIKSGECDILSTNGYSDTQIIPTIHSLFFVLCSIPQIILVS